MLWLRAWGHDAAAQGGDKTEQQTGGREAGVIGFVLILYYAMAEIQGSLKAVLLGLYSLEVACKLGLQGRCAQQPCQVVGDSGRGVACG